MTDGTADTCPWASPNNLCLNGDVQLREPSYVARLACTLWVFLKGFVALKHVWVNGDAIDEQRSFAGPCQLSVHALLDELSTRLGLSDVSQGGMQDEEFRG